MKHKLFFVPLILLLVLATILSSCASAIPIPLTLEGNSAGQACGELVAEVLPEESENASNEASANKVPLTTPYDFRGVTDHDTIVEAVEDIIRLQNKQFAIKKFQVYVITAEDLAAWRASHTSFESFFGFDAEQLRSVFGRGVVLSFSGGTPSKGEILPQSPSNETSETSSEVNIDEFMANVAMTITKGMAVILVAAALAPLSGGSTFVCAFTAITKMAASAAAVGSGSTFVVKTIAGLAQGKTFQTATEEAGLEALKVFGDSFLVGALVGGAIAQTVNVCFPANTLILLADGSLRAIQKVRIGDEVLCYDTERGEMAIRKVTRTFTNTATELVKVQTLNGEITCTAEHPFYTQNGWRPADRLSAGDLLMTSDGSTCEVVSVTYEARDAEIPVYNFEVEDFHSYFVACEGSCVLVHNQCSVPSLEHGAYGHIKKEKKYSVHHVPAAKYMTNIYGIDPAACPSIKIPTTTHYKTFTYGRWSKKKTEFYMNLTPDEALRLDLSNLRASLKATGQWTDDMAEALDDYVRMCHEMYPHLFSLP